MERRTAYTHPGTGAQMRLLKIEETRWAQVLNLFEALGLSRENGLKLLVNTKTGRAAPLARAAAETLDDGSVTERVRLIRPTARETISQDAFARSYWKEAPLAMFGQAWSAEADATPEFKTRAFSIVTGLLLPIWNRLPGQGVRVYRLVTDEGERIVSRLVAPEALAAVCEALGLTDAPTLTPAEAWAAVMERAAILHLAGGLQVRRVTTMGGSRVELIGVGEGALAGLKAIGCTSEIIAWKLRLFIPVTAQGPDVLGTVLAKHPLVRCVAATPAAAA